MRLSLFAERLQKIAPGVDSIDVGSSKLGMFDTERKLWNRRFVQPDALVMVSSGSRASDVSLVPVGQLGSHRVSRRPVSIDIQVAGVVPCRAGGVRVVLCEVVVFVQF